MDFQEYADPQNPAIDKYRQAINTQANVTAVPPCALAAIVENESNGRNIFQEGVAAGDGCGVGLCQITYAVNWSDLNAPSYNGHPLLVPSANLYVAGRYFLRPAIDAAIALRLDPARAGWMQTISAQLLYFAFAAYNLGPEAVADLVTQRIDPDEKTTDHYATRALAIYTRNLERSALEATAR
jgi:hypothetical protein